MKLWFVEPRPNVFISGIKDSVADNVVEYLYKHCPAESGLMVFKKIKQVPGYKIRGVGNMRRSFVEINGLQLVQEKGGIL
jgi:CRISPR-associated protein Cas2|tara:strand:+ start:8102 stop:8341 length:240 start_codon:yes stop_codon:yes gene_type:complete